MKMKGLVILLCCSAAFLVCADNKIHPGSMCGSQYGNQESSLERKNGNIKNIGSSNIVVFCPVVKDKTKEQTLNHLNLFTSFNTQSTCAGATLNTSGMSIDHISVATIGANSGVTTSISRDTDSGDNGSSFYVKCILTPNSTLHYYKTSE